MRSVANFIERRTCTAKGEFFVSFLRRDLHGLRRRWKIESAPLESSSTRTGFRRHSGRSRTCSKLILVLKSSNGLPVAHSIFGGHIWGHFVGMEGVTCLLYIPERSRALLVSPLSHGGSHRFESYSAHHLFKRRFGLFQLPFRPPIACVRFMGFGQ